MCDGCEGVCVRCEMNDVCVCCDFCVCVVCGDDVCGGVCDVSDEKMDER